MTTPMMTRDVVDLVEYDDPPGSGWDGATTQFWGDPVTDVRYDYSEGKLCPHCLEEGIETIITNGATLCHTHRNRVNVKTKLDVRRCIAAARRRR